MGFAEFGREPLEIPGRRGEGAGSETRDIGLVAEAGALSRSDS